MRILEDNGNIIVSGIADFDVDQTLCCGQCFHFKKTGEGKDYGVSAFGRLLHIVQEGKKVIFYNTTKADFNGIWRKYFDLDTDYASIKNKLLQDDSKLADSINAMGGVRILKQDFFETLMSFIISQNKQIPHIKAIVCAISKEYGTYLGEINGEEFYAFPTAKMLSNVTEDDFKRLKTGFRAGYLYDAVKCVLEGKITEEMLRNMEAAECEKALCQIKGVGAKVANCVMLFALSKMECFPIDVWMTRIMQRLYLGEGASKDAIAQYAREHYGALGGYAQQYLFYYGRETKMS